MKVAEKGNKVKVHYTGTLDDGSQFDSSVGKDPLEFEVGAGQMIPGFDKGVEGMKIDDVKNIHIPATEAYGERIAELIQEVSKDLLPKDMEVQIGQTLVSQTPEGQQFNVVVTEMTDSTITVDGNHPLAGQALNFEITMVEIN